MMDEFLSGLSYNNIIYLFVKNSPVPS